MTKIAIASLLCVLVGCAADAAEGNDGETGTLALSLVGSDAGQQTYRLRAATFDIQGTRYYDYQSVSTSVSSESDPDGAFLRARLFPGSYSVSLRPGEWYLERIGENGSERVQQAVLLSSATQSAYVQQGYVSQVAFQFGVDGELIDFIGSDLDIGITVQRAPDAGASAGSGS